MKRISWQISLSLNYDFTPSWSGAFANFNHQQVNSGFDNRFTGFMRSFDRDQYQVGCTPALLTVPKLRAMW